MLFYDDVQATNLYEIDFTKKVDNNINTIFQWSSNDYIRKSICQNCMVGTI